MNNKPYIIIIIITINIVSTLDLTELKGYQLYLNEICSYNGIPKIVLNQVVCECEKEYITLNKENRSIRGQMIQCNYPKKRRFIVLFFAIFIPFGLDYAYLEHYIVFSFLFLFFILFLATVGVYFCLSNNYLCFAKKENSIVNAESRKQKKNQVFQSQIDVQAQKDPNEKDHKKEIIIAYPKFRIIIAVISALLLAWWFTDIGLMASGIIKDANGIETISDLNFLISINGNS